MRSCSLRVPVVVAMLVIYSGLLRAQPDVEERHYFKSETVDGVIPVQTEIWRANWAIAKFSTPARTKPAVSGVVYMNDPALSFILSAEKIKAPMRIEVDHRSFAVGLQMGSMDVPGDLHDAKLKDVYVSGLRLERGEDEYRSSIAVARRKGDENIPLGRIYLSVFPFPELKIAAQAYISNRPVEAYTDAKGMVSWIKLANP